MTTPDPLTAAVGEQLAVALDAIGLARATGSAAVVELALHTAELADTGCRFAAVVGAAGHRDQWLALADELAAAADQLVDTFAGA